jgi:Flp pilus assembly secretin CpaC
MMVLFVGHSGPLRGSVHRRCILAFALALGLAASVLPAANVQAADIPVVLDQARLVKLPEKVATIVIGNPLIVDATLQSGGQVLLTGKSYGATNIMALDRSGAVLTEMTVRVGGEQADLIMVFRGVNRETYSCTPDCQPRIMLGDVQPYFATRIGQAAARNGASQAAGK